MIRTLFLVPFLVLGLITPALAQVENFAPVTKEMLLNPSPNDWLMFSRTYDNQRFSPLRQITRRNVRDLRLAWIRGMRPGVHEHIPLVYRGVMYVANPGGIEALDATSGDLIWEYRRNVTEDRRGRAGRTIAIYKDLIFYTTPDEYLVAVDARTGELRWETKDAFASSGPKVIGGKVMGGMAGCGVGTRGGAAECIMAYDPRTGKELWKFYTTAAPSDPGGDSWGTVPVEKRSATAWGLPGAYDPVHNLIYWGIANPSPHTRMKRHGGNVDDIPRSAPADLYSNSTVALDPETGKLAWYYQHLPGDDWDADHTQERILLRTTLDPDPEAVKWINPRIARGQERQVVVSLGEPGGIWVLDPAQGEFLWATPFPYDVPEFHISHIDVETGKTYLNWDLVIKTWEDRHVMCFHNTKGYWPMAYHPGKNSLYIPFHDQCVDTTANIETSNGNGPRVGVLRPGADPSAYAGIAKVDMATGRMQRILTQRAPNNGAMLATAGDVLFWGDMNRRFRAFDADTGKILWETILGGIIQMSTITYSVNGKQYVAVLTGDGRSGTRGPLNVVSELKPPRGHNAIYVFALPE
ncbi:PQQ-binding-like beta-propeller repeat protein [Acidobacteria bacterium AH-259-D05]|nr:PQQ-binding-like beta-propeller repeat protein [Acidobacteria bacterium AH-259-D05]